MTQHLQQQQKLQLHLYTKHSTRHHGQKKIRCTVGLATAERWVFGRGASGFGSWASVKSVSPACRLHSLALPRHQCLPHRLLSRHWRSLVRPLGPPSLETTSLTRQLQQQQGQQVCFSLSSTSRQCSCSSSPARLQQQSDWASERAIEHPVK
jgi:hypothetical protein